MQRPNQVLGGSSISLLLASQALNGRLRVEWTSPALSVRTGACDAQGYAQAALDGLLDAPPDESAATFELSRTGAGGTEHLDRVSGRRFVANGTRYWVASFANAKAVKESGQKRDHLRDQIDDGAAAVQRILRVTEAMRAQVTTANALATIPPLLVPVVAQWATVQVLNSRGDAWAASSAAHEDGSFPAGFHRYVRPLLPVELRGSAHNAVMAGRMPFALTSPVGDNELAMSVPPESAEYLKTMSIGSSLIVPLLAGATVIGTMLLVRDRERPSFRRQDVDMMRLLGKRIGNTLVSIERTQERRRRAIAAQDALLPELPSVPGVEAVAVYRPSASYASVGGDWFDVVALERGALGLSIGDVCGHDTGSLGAMAAYRWTIRTYLWQGRDPAQALELLDRQVCSSREPPQLATAIVARVDRSDPDRFRLSYATAGHLPAVVVDPDGNLTVLDEATSIPIGIVRPAGPRPIRSLEFPYASTVVMFTDGVVERRDVPLKERIEELHAALGAVHPAAPVEEYRGALVRFNEGLSLEDDMSFVIARIGPTPAFADGAVPAREKVRV